MLASLVQPLKAWFPFGRPTAELDEPPTTIAVLPSSALQPTVTKHETAVGQRRRGALTEADVRQIKRRLNAGEKGSALAREFGVGHQTVSDIRRGLTWARVVVDEEPGA